MPKVSRKRGAGRYRPYARRTKKQKQKSFIKGNTTVSTNPSTASFGLSDSLTTRLRYVESYTLTSNSGAAAKQVMRMNSLFDPDFTGTGHQPYYFDQLSALYKRYVVRGCKLVAEFSMIPSAITTTNPSGPGLIGVVSDDDGTTSTTLSTLLESSSCRHQLISGANGGPAVKTMTLFYSPEREIGLPWTDDTVSAGVTANPSKPWFGTVFFAEAGLATQSSVIVKLTMEFFVTFSERKDVSGS